MATLRLEQLECVHPDDPRTDEITLRVAHDGGDTCYEINRSMREGETVDLDASILFSDLVEIRLSERDLTHEDNLGSVTIGHPLPDGPQVAAFPMEIVGEGDPGYRLTFHVDASEEDAAPRNRIELLSLKCNDAQGTHDDISLYVNDDLRWGPTDMRTGQEFDLGGRSVDFRSSVTVRLQETRSADWQSEFTLTYARHGEGGYRINTRLTHNFSVDRGIRGDASYTLTYQLRRLPAR